MGEQQFVCLQIHNDYQIPGGETKTAHLIADLLERNGVKVIRYYKTNMEYVNNKGIFCKLKAGFHSLNNPETTKELNDILDKEHVDFALIHNVVSVISNAAYKVLIKRGISIIKYLQNYNLVCLNGALDHGKICEMCQKNNLVGVRCKCYKENFAYSFIKFLIKRDMDKHILFHISAFMSNSKFVMRQHINRGIDGSKMHVMYNYVNIPKITFEGEYDYYLYFGRLTVEKGIFTTISAFEKMPDNQLVIMGSGTLEDEITRRTEKIKNIEYIGNREGRELFEYVAKAKAVIVPSEWDEPLPRVILEAYSQGTPVIGSHRGGIPELIVKGKTGYIFKSSDSASLRKNVEKLESLDNNAYQEMRNNCINLIERDYTSLAYYNRFIDCIKNVLFEKGAQ